MTRPNSAVLRAAIAELEEIAQRMDRIAKKCRPRYLTDEFAGVVFTSNGETLDVATMERVEG